MKSIISIKIFSILFNLEGRIEQNFPLKQLKNSTLSQKKTSRNHLGRIKFFSDKKQTRNIYEVKVEITISRNSKQKYYNTSKNMTNNVSDKKLNE